MDAAKHFLPVCRVTIRCLYYLTYDDKNGCETKRMIVWYGTWTNADNESKSRVGGRGEGTKKNGTNEKKKIL